MNKCTCHICGPECTDRYASARYLEENKTPKQDAIDEALARFNVPAEFKDLALSIAREAYHAGHIAGINKMAERVKA